MKRVSAILVALVLATPGRSWSADYHWNNFSGGLWSEPSNWSPAGPPTLDDRAFLDLAGTYTGLVDAAAEAKSIVVGGASGTQTLRLEGATFDFQDSLTILAGGRLESETSTANGPFTRCQGSMLLTDTQFTGQLVN